MNDETKPGVGVKMEAVVLKLGAWEPRQEREVRPLLVHHDLGEVKHDLWKPVAVPKRVLAKHWRTNQDEPLRSGTTKLQERNKSYI